MSNPDASKVREQIKLMSGGSTVFQKLASLDQYLDEKLNNTKTANPKIR